MSWLHGTNSWVRVPFLEAREDTIYKIVDLKDNSEYKKWDVLSEIKRDYLSWHCFFLWTTWCELVSDDQVKDLVLEVQGSVTRIQEK